MGLQPFPSCSPDADQALLTDNTVGSSYDIVKEVYQHLEALHHIAANLDFLAKLGDSLELRVDDGFIQWRSVVNKGTIPDTDGWNNLVEISIMIQPYITEVIALYTEGKLEFDETAEEIRQSISGFAQSLTNITTTLAADPRVTSYPQYNTLLEAVERNDIPATQVCFETSGFYIAGDIGRGRYFRASTEPAHPAKRLIGTQWWELEKGEVRLEQIGVKPGVNDAATMTENTRLLNLVFKSKHRHWVFPPERVWTNGPIGMVGGIHVRGFTKLGVTWNNITDNILTSAFRYESGIVAQGSGQAVIVNADPTVGVQHFEFENLSINVPNNASYNWVVDIYGMLNGKVDGCTFRNESGANPQGFRTTSIGDVPSWLNRFFLSHVYLPDSSGGKCWDLDCSDSSMTDCSGTGGAGSIYRSHGNFSVKGGIFDRNKAGSGAWTVLRKRESGTCVHFIGVSFDEYYGYGLVISADMGSTVIPGNYMGVTVEACNFRRGAGATGDIIFADGAVKMYGVSIRGCKFQSPGVARSISYNPQKWDVFEDGNIDAMGSPWTRVTGVPTAGGGVFESATYTLRYEKVGRRLYFSINVQVSLAGSSAGGIDIIMPFPGVAEAPGVFMGRNNTTGGAILGFLRTQNPYILRLLNIDNSHAGTNGANIMLSGVYEVAV